jgi:hypothetical protein
MRFTAVCARVCLWIYCWCSWKRWLYLTAFLLTSSHFFLSEKFLPNLKNQMDITDVSQPAGTTQENVISSSINQLNNLNKSTIFTAKLDSVQSTTKKSIDGNEETNWRKIEQVNNSSSLFEEKERRYRLRSERVKRVCLSRGVVSNPPIFTMSKKELPIDSPDLTNLSGKN